MFTYSGGEWNFPMPNFDGYVNIQDNCLFARQTTWADKDNHYAAIEMPDVLKEDIKIRLEKGGILILGSQLVIEYKRNKGIFDKGLTLKSSVLIPNDVDFSKIDAKLEDGILIITMSRKIDRDYRSIPVC